MRPDEFDLSMEFRAGFSEFFHLLPEARMRDPLTGASLRIDYLAWPRVGEGGHHDPGLILPARFRGSQQRPRPFPMRFFGIEVKGEECDKHSRYSAALRQCIDYKRAVVDDGRAPFDGHPPAVFLWRGWDQREPENVSPERGGAVRLAGQFDVGEVVREQRELILTMSDTPMWTPSSGTVFIGTSWREGRHLGAGARRSP